MRLFLSTLLACSLTSSLALAQTSSTVPETGTSGTGTMVAPDAGAPDPAAGLGTGVTSGVTGTGGGGAMTGVGISTGPAMTGMGNSLSGATSVRVVEPGMGTAGTAAGMGTAGTAAGMGPTGTTGMTTDAGQPLSGQYGSATGSADVSGTGNTVPPPTNPGTGNDAADPEVIEFGALEEGANSFTEGQIRARLEDAGLTDIGALTLDDRGIWSGTASRSGQQVTIGIDYRGNMAFR